MTCPGILADEAAEFEPLNLLEREAGADNGRTDREALGKRLRRIARGVHAQAEPAEAFGVQLPGFSVVVDNQNKFGRD